MVREGSSGTCELDTCFLAMIYNRLCTAIHSIKADKISSVRLSPFSYSKTIKLFGKNLFNHFKLWSDDIRMLTHMLYHTMNILEETYMTELVNLIVSDSLMLHLISYIIQVV